jgi:hypothetical protein
MTSQMVIYPQFEDHSITVESTEVPETMPEGLTEITFSDFGIADGTYTVTETLGVYKNGSLDGTVFSGKVTFEAVGGNTWFMITKNGDWNGGLVLCQRDNDEHKNLYLRTFNKATGGTTAIATLTPEIAGVQLTGAEFDLQLSFQMVDNDGDGAKDDLKLGIWFNGVLYDNEYFYFNDCAFAQSDMTSRIILFAQSGFPIKIESTV